MRANVYCGNLLWQSSLNLPALGEEQSGEAIEKTVAIGNDAEPAIAVSRVKACCGG